MLSFHLSWTPDYVWTHQPGSHRRKSTQDFSSTFLLRCLPCFLSREGFSLPFPSSTVKSNYVYTHELILFSTCSGKIPVSIVHPCVQLVTYFVLEYRARIVFRARIKIEKYRGPRMGKKKRKKTSRSSRKSTLIMAHGSTQFAGFSSVDK